MESDRESSSGATFNGSIATLERINDHLRASSTYSIVQTGKTIMLRKAYDHEIFKELYPFLKPSERDAYKVLWDKITGLKLEHDPIDKRIINWHQDIPCLLYTSPSPRDRS